MKLINILMYFEPPAKKSIIPQKVYDCFKNRCKLMITYGAITSANTHSNITIFNWYHLRQKKLILLPICLFSCYFFLFTFVPAAFLLLRRFQRDILTCILCGALYEFQVYDLESSDYNRATGFTSDLQFLVHLPPYPKCDLKKNPFKWTAVRVELFSFTTLRVRFVSYSVDRKTKTQL